MSTPLAMIQDLLDPPAEIPDSTARTAGGMSEDDILGMVKAEVDAARQVAEGTLASNRAMARSYFNAEEFGNEIDGKSRVVMTDVRDTILWSMPGMMKTFFGGANFGVVRPTMPGTEATAAAATKALNHKFLHECGGYRVTYDCIFNALLEKLGAGRVYTEVKKEVCYKDFQEVSTERVTALVNQPGWEILEAEEAGPPMTVLGPQGPMMLLLWNVRFRVTEQRVRLRVRSIPPENFWTSPRASAINDEIPAAFETYQITKSELIALGFDQDIVMSLPSHPSDDDTNGLNVSRYKEEDPASIGSPDRGGDDPMAKVWLVDGFCRIDEDGDGIAELRHVIVAGKDANKLLLDEYAPWVEFFGICPMLVPHTIHGKSQFDLTWDLQLVGSILVRNQLDNIYVLNNGRWAVREGDVEIDGLIENNPGGLVFFRGESGAVERLDAPALGDAPLAMRGFLDGVKEQRTGMSRTSRGLDASAMRNTTATGIDEIMSAADATQEQVARNFAMDDGGFKRMFLLMHREYASGPYKREQLMIGEQWVDFDPNTWSAEAGVEIEVGIGKGRAGQQLQNFATIDTMQQGANAAMPGYFVTPRNRVNLHNAVVETMGYRTNPFFTDPGDTPPPPPPPSPEMILAQAEDKKVALDQQLDPTRIQAAAEKDKADATLKAAEVALRSRELDIRLEIDLKRLENDKIIKLAEIQSREKIADMQAEAQKAAAKEQAKKPAGGAASA